MITIKFGKVFPMWSELQSLQCNEMKQSFIAQMLYNKIKTTITCRTQAEGTNPLGKTFMWALDSSDIF